jgi:hypothetical protein
MFTAVLSFLDTKIRPSEQDPEKKWINTWNDYARRIKRFFRWLHNTRERTQPVFEQTDWITPEFVNIKEKKDEKNKPLFGNRIVANPISPAIIEPRIAIANPAPPASNALSTATNFLGFIMSVHPYSCLYGMRY